MKRLLILIFASYSLCSCQLSSLATEVTYEITLADVNGVFGELILDLPGDFDTIHSWERLHASRCMKLNNTRIQNSKAGVDQEHELLHFHKYKTVDQITITNYVYADCSSWVNKGLVVKKWFEYQKDMFSWDIYKPNVLMLDSLMIDSIKLGVVGTAWNNHPEYEGDVYEVKAAGVINGRFVQITFLSNMDDQSEYFLDSQQWLSSLNIRIKLKPT